MDEYDPRVAPAPLSGASKQVSPYELAIKAELSKVELPLFFRYIFFFVSLWDFETDWQVVTFTL